MRLPPLPPERLAPEQRRLYDRTLAQIAQGFTAFKTQAPDGSLLGPWGVFLHEPTVGQAHHDLIAAITALKRLPEAAKQIAIVATGARFKAAYELYAHVAVATAADMDPAKLATVAAGERPSDLSAEEVVTLDVVAALLRGGVLPDATYRAARGFLGQAALNELVFWVATYAGVSIVLNAFDVPSEAEWAE